MRGMQRLTFAAAFVATALLGTLSARATTVGSARDFGLGFALGTPTSIVGKYFFDPVNALDFGVGFWRAGRRCNGPGPIDCDDWGYFGVNVDYLWHETLARGTAKLDWHIGIGGRLWIEDDTYDDDIGLGPRMPVGLDLTFDRPDFVEVFFELAPVLLIVPGPDFEIEAFVGVRFYF